MSAHRPRTVLALRREPGHLVRSFTALILRLALGMIFLSAGLQKYRDVHAAPEAVDGAAAEPIVIEEAGPGAGGLDATETAASEPEPDGVAKPEAPPRYPDSIEGMFAETILAKRLPALLDLFVRVLPYAEMGLGAALIVGFWTPVSAILSGALLVSLLFGWVVLGKNDQYPMMLTYLLTNAAILWLSPVTSNYFSLDGVLFGWFWRPRSEGRFEAEDEPVPVRTRAAPGAGR